MPMPPKAADMVAEPLPDIMELVMVVLPIREAPMAVLPIKEPPIQGALMEIVSALRGLEADKPCINPVTGMIVHIFKALVRVKVLDPAMVMAKRLARKVMDTGRHQRVSTSNIIKRHKPKRFQPFRRRQRPYLRLAYRFVHQERSWARTEHVS